MPATEANRIKAGTATRVTDWRESRGEGAVYRLDPLFDDAGRPIEFVVASAVDLDFGTSDTRLFPSDGLDVTDWDDLAMVPYKSHEDALAQLGYEVSA